VDRPGNKLRITIRTSRPGIIIGRKGAEIEKLKQEMAKKTKREVFIDIQEVHKPELDAQLVAESIALQLEKRVAFRRAMRKAVDSALRFGCKGIKVRVSGRLNGAEIARSEWYLQGQLPLHTLRADIDYGFAEAHTTYGVIGIKCWVYKGEFWAAPCAGRCRLSTEPRRDRRDRRTAPPGRSGEPRPSREPRPRRSSCRRARRSVQMPPPDLPRPGSDHRRSGRRKRPAPPARRGSRKSGRPSRPEEAEPNEKPEGEINAMLMPKKGQVQQAAARRRTGKAWRGSTLASATTG
jgi:small subunit ribosomal protein S3